MSSLHVRHIRSAQAYLFGALDALFNTVRGRDDPESIREADDLLRDLLEAGRNILGADAMSTNLKYYARRMVDRGRLGDALKAMQDAHQVLVDANRSVAERGNLRDNLTRLAFRAALRSDLEPEVYDRALEAAERALMEEPGNAAMTVALGAVLYRLGEFALAAETLAQPSQPLSRSPGGLARKMGPADHAFRALVHARLGDEEAARRELATLRAAIAGKGADDQARAILREIEALLESPPSSTEDR